MKRVFDISSAAALAVALVLLLSLNSATPWYWSAPTPNSNKVRFASLPVDQARRVQVDWGDGSLGNGTERQQRDQILDWLLITAVSNAGLSTKEISEVLWDLPPARYGYVQPVGDFEYGASRSRDIGNGEVIALIPAGDSRRTELLSTIADQQRNNTGRIPKVLFVFEYQLSPAVTLTRREQVDGKDLFTPAMGYHEEQIRDRQSLERFLSEHDDLTDAKVENDGLRLGGRRIGGGYLGIRLEDAAALWQSEAKVQESLATLKRFEAKWDHVTYRTDSEKEKLEAEYKDEKKKLEQSLPGHHAVNGSGFSLDPTYDFRGLLQMFQAVCAKHPTAASAQEIEQVTAALGETDPGPLLDLFDRWAHDEANPVIQSAIPEGKLLAFRSLPPDDRVSLAAMLLSRALANYKFQAARYDGSLQGTEVGMTLFYTDLLAKLKAIDFWGDRAIEDFQPLTEARVSKAYRAEMEHWPDTRLWFGPRATGFQVTQDGLFFARNSTRVYAASSSDLTPGKEVEPNAESAQFLGWWNDHYDEIARYEPQYERLNEIMKWSLLISWLDQKSGGGELGFLGHVKVNCEYWFPDWVRNHTHLRYQSWNRVPFYPQGYKHSATEAMPLLRSAPYREFGTIYEISGGVSLGDTEVFEERAVLPNVARQDLENLKVRAGVDFRAQTAEEPDVVHTLDKVTHSIREEEGVVETISTAKDTVKFRTLVGDVRNAPVDRTYSPMSSGIEIDLRAGATKVGRFYSDISTDQIRVGFRALDLDQGQAVAERLSAAIARQENLGQVIAGNPRIQLAIRMDCDGCYAVKLRGSEGWLKLAPENKPSVEIAPGWDARVASLDDNARNYNLAWVDDKKLATELGSARYVRVDLGARGANEVPLEVSNRGPPPTAQKVEVRLAGVGIDADKAPDGIVYFQRDKIPAALLEDPKELISALRSNEGDDLVSDLDIPDYRRLTDKIAEDPISAKRRLDEILATRRADVDQALASGEDAVSNRYLKSLIDVSGPDPDLFARRAIANLESPKTAVQEIQRSLRGPLRDPDSLFTVINSRLRRHGITTAQQDNLYRLAELFDFHVQQARLGLSGEIRPVVENGGIDFHYRLTERVPSIRASEQEVRQSAGPAYVLDSPAIDSIEWIPSVQAVDDAAVSHPIVKLPRWDIAHFQPRVIETPQGNYRLLNRAWRAGQQYQRLNSDEQPCTDQHRGASSCQDHLYLLNRQTPGSLDIAKGRFSMPVPRVSR